MYVTNNAKYTTSIGTHTSHTHYTSLFNLLQSSQKTMSMIVLLYHQVYLRSYLGLIIHSHYNTSLIMTAASVFLVLNNKHHLITSQCLLIILPAMPHVNISSILFLSSHCLLIFASDPFKTQCANTWRTMTGAHGDKKVYNYKLISQFRR